jgi:hypothetical protein
MFFFSSCATLINKESYEVLLTTNHPETQIQLEDKSYYLPYYLNVERSEEDLSLKLFNDTVTKDFIVKPSLSPRFIYGNLVWFCACPVAYIVDLNNEKRFYYGKSIYLDLNDTTTIIKNKASKVYTDYFSNIKEANPGQINLNFTFPLLNNFYIHPENESLKSSTGALGISLGLDYFYKKRKFINFSASGVMDISSIAENLNYVDEEALRSLSLNLTDNFKTGRFSFGYGINYSIHSWFHSYYDQVDTPSPIYNSETKNKQALGLTLSGYHRIWKNLNVGIEYRPTFININPELNFKYEHVLSFGVAFRIRIKK